MTRTVRSLLALLGLSIIALLVWRTGPRLISSMLARVGWSFAAVTALYAAHLGLRAAALRHSVLNVAVSYADVLRIRFSGEAVEVLTFTGPFLAEPAIGVLLKQRGVSTAEAFAAVATEYLLYTVVSACLAAIALSLLLGRDALAPAARPAAALGLAIAIAFVAGVAFAAVTGIGLMVPITRASRFVIGERRAEWAVRQIGPIEDVLLAFLHEHPGRLAHVLALEIAAHLLLVSEIWIVMTALGLPLSWADPLIVEGGAKFITLGFAFIPGQLGVVESIYTLLVRTIGLPAAAGLTLALVRRMRGLLVAGAGVILLGTLGDR